MLCCENLSVTQSGRVIFSGLGFSLASSSLLLLKGANGSGKTTLLKTLAGLIKPDCGQVEHEGTIQYIGHKTAVKPRLTVKENLAFYAELYGTPELLMAGISYFDLEPMMEIPCYKLSAGWQKRVALARLMVCYSDIWLLDEPEVHLDARGKEMLFKLIQVRVDQGGITLLASHEELKIPPTSTLAIEDFAPLTP
jgi:heme exporter protein A